MRRMILWPTVGLVLGFIAFAILFRVANERIGPDEKVFLVFSLMAAIPVGIFAAILAAFGTLRDELSLFREEVERLQRLEVLLDRKAVSTEIQADPGRPY